MAVNDWFKGSPVDPWAGFPGVPAWRWSSPAHDSITITDPGTGMHLFLFLDSSYKRQPEPPLTPPIWAESDVTWRDTNRTVTWLGPEQVEALESSEMAELREQDTSDE